MKNLFRSKNPPLQGNSQPLPTSPHHTVRSASDPLTPCPLLPMARTTLFPRVPSRIITMSPFEKSCTRGRAKELSEAVLLPYVVPKALVFPILKASLLLVSGYLPLLPLRRSMATKVRLPLLVPSSMPRLLAYFLIT